MMYHVVRRGVEDMVITIRLTKEEEMLAESYAKKHSLSPEEAFKQALFECIEEDYDAIVAEEAYQEYLDSGCKSLPIAEFWKHLDSEI